RLTLDPVRASYRMSLMAVKQPDARFPATPEELLETEYQARRDLAHLARPRTVASVLGAQLSPRNPLAGLASLYNNMAHQEVFGSTAGRKLGGAFRQNLSLLLSGSDPQQLIGMIAAAAAGPSETPGQEKQLVLQPEALSGPAMRPVLLAALEERLAVGLVRYNLETMRAELKKLQSTPPKAEEYV